MEDGNAAESWRLFCKTAPFSWGLLALFFGNCVLFQGLTSREDKGLQPQRPLGLTVTEPEGG